MIRKFFTFPLMFIYFFSPLMALYESNRLDELNAEYNKGAKSGSYSLFVKELKEKLQKTEDLKEAARLATLIRAYIHGQIIAFDSAKSLNQEDKLQVFQAHATTTAFFTLSPFGTDRYREDTLRHVMNDVKGTYAQELTIIADAVQAALWAGKAGTRQHVEKEVFLRWMTPSYQEGPMNVSQALGRWGLGNHKKAKEFIHTTLNILYDQNSSSQLQPSLLITKKQKEKLQLQDGTTINVPGKNNQCGFYSIGKPSMRHQDSETNGPRQKFTESFQRAYYDPQLFWMLVAFSGKAKDLDLTIKTDDTAEKKQKENNANKQAIQENMIMFSVSKEMLEIKDKEEIKSKIKDPTEEKINIFENMWNNNEFLITEDLAHVRQLTSNICDAITAYARTHLSEGNQYNTFVSERKDEIEKRMDPTIEKARDYYRYYQNESQNNQTIKNTKNFKAISESTKKIIIEAAISEADKILNLGNGQLEINPGTDVSALDAQTPSLDTLIAYLNDRELNVLCTETVMRNNPQMRLSEDNKVNGYYCGKKVANHGFGSMYTVNHGGATGGHYQFYVRPDTPHEAIANALRSPIRIDKKHTTAEGWDLLALAKNDTYYSKNNRYYSHNFRDQVDTYDWKTTS